VRAAVSCALLGVTVSWFYKWLHRAHTGRARRRGELDTRVHADLAAEGWRVSVNTVADSMRRHGLAGRKPKRRWCLTKQDRQAPKFADRTEHQVVPGEITEIPP
jgi:putative transposase